MKRLDNSQHVYIYMLTTVGEHSMIRAISGHYKHNQNIWPQGGSVWQLVSPRHALEDKLPSKVLSCLDNLQFSSILWEWAKWVWPFLPEWFKQTTSQLAHPLLFCPSWWNWSANEMKLKLGFKEKTIGIWDTSQSRLINVSSRSAG